MTDKDVTMKQTEIDMLKSLISELNEILVMLQSIMDHNEVARSIYNDCEVYYMSISAALSFALIESLAKEDKVG